MMAAVVASRYNSWAKVSRNPHWESYTFGWYGKNFLKRGTSSGIYLGKWSEFESHHSSMTNFGIDRGARLLEGIKQAKRRSRVYVCGASIISENMSKHIRHLSQSRVHSYLGIIEVEWL